jgi:molybdate transport system ATP-binding protein
MLNGRFTLDLKSFSIKVNFEIPTNKITVIRGKSGAGKTQFLKCLAGLVVPNKSFISYHNNCWQDDKHNIFVPPHKRDISFVFQYPSLFPHLSIMNNLKYGYKRTPIDKRRIHLNDVLNGLQLKGLLNHRVRTLSGGERQRIAIARALLTSPKVLLMDEPVTSIDANGKADVLSYLKDIQRKLSLTIIYVSHSVEEEQTIAGNTLNFQDGQLCPA